MANFEMSGTVTDAFETDGNPFRSVDYALDHGAEWGLDALAFVPEVNTVVEAAQGAYHQAHAVYDLAEGDYSGAAKEYGKAVFHGGMGVLDYFTEEGGAAVEEGVAVAETAEEASTALEAAETVGQVEKYKSALE